MSDCGLRYDDPDFPWEGVPKIRSRLTSDFLKELRKASGINTDDEPLRHRLAKDLSRYQSAVSQAHEPVDPPQNRELQSLKKAADRFAMAFDRLNSRSKCEVDYEILYRPPFNSRFYFREQLAYWDANEDSVKRARSLAKMISWSIERVYERREAEKDGFRRTKNTPLDHLIQDLMTAFENGTGEKPKNHCHYNPSSDGYTGKYFDFVVKILEKFAPNSYHSELALGKRIVRQVAERDV